MIECVSAGMPELDSAIQRARRKLQDMEEAPRLGGHCTAIKIISLSMDFCSLRINMDYCLFVILYNFISYDTI